MSTFRLERGDGAIMVRSAAAALAGNAAGDGGIRVPPIQQLYNADARWNDADGSGFTRARAAQHR